MEMRGRAAAEPLLEPPWAGNRATAGVVAPPDCFDAAQATGPVLELPIGAIVDPLVGTHLPDRITAYRSALARGDRFPPIAVVRPVGRYLVADGHKRLAACRQLGEQTIVVEVWTLRRWLRDQRRQFRRKTRQQITLLLRSPIDASARRQAGRLLWDTVGHWTRIARSLRHHLSRLLRGGGPS